MNSHARNACSSPAFFAGRARHPRFKSRRGRQSAHYTRSAFTLRGGELRLAKMAAPLRFVWSWPQVDVTELDPTMVNVSRERSTNDSPSGAHLPHGPRRPHHA